MSINSEGRSNDAQQAGSRSDVPKLATASTAINNHDSLH